MDLRLIDIGNGGDLIKTPKDLKVITGFENMVYLALFGGNVEGITPIKRDPKNDQAQDWWGNKLLFEDDQSIQLNSITEKTLNNVALTSSGRIAIEEAVKKDLKFMSEFAIVKVSVTIISSDRILILVRLEKPGNVQLKDYAYIWDATNKGLLDWEAVMNGVVRAPVVDNGIFDFSFDESFE